MTDESTTRVTRFARLWTLSFVKIIAVLLAVVIALVAVIQVLLLPIHIGMWVEMGYGPLEGWHVPVNGLSAKWWYAQVAWVVILIAAVIAAINAWSKVND